MNDHDPHADFADLEARLRGWRPTELPAGLHARLRSAEPPPTRRRTVRALAGALALAAGLAWLAFFRFAAPSSPVETAGAEPGGSPTLRYAPEPEGLAGTPWVFGESLTMNLATGVSPGIVPAALRLDDGPAELSDLILVRSADGKLPLKVDCQF